MVKRVRVYSTNYCPYCTMAKKLLVSEGLPYEEISLEGEEDLRMKLASENGGWRTVPMIFIGDEFIGGFQDLAKLKQSGELHNKAKE